MTRKGPAITLTLAALVVLMASCSPPTGGGDGDADTDTDADGDRDGDETCPADWECCRDAECSNSVYCDGIEVCDRGQCERGFPIDCDDGLGCTQDICDEQANLCAHLPVHGECDDGRLCNGTERCEPGDEEADRDGCVVGLPMVCDDGDDCTEDYCEDDLCLVRVRDADDDGHGDRDCAVCDETGACERGDDCDDGDATIYPGAEEICDDGKDNNCDRDRDYADPTCSVPNDGCADALTLTPDVVVHSSTRGTVGDIDSSCSATAELDVAFVFTIATVQDVEIDVSVSGGTEVTVALTADCGNPDADLRCTSGNTFTQIHRALPAGTYYAVVSTGSEADFDVMLSHYEPVARPDGDQCATAADVSGGGAFTGSTDGFDPDYDSRCGSATDLDMTYAFTLTAAQSMDISVTGGLGPVTVALQRTCGVTGTERGCFTAEPSADRHYRSLEPGTYYLIFKTPVGDDFSFDLSFGPAEDTVPLNFIGLPWDFFDWDAVSAEVLYRAVTYGFGAEPTVGAVQECVDTTGSTSASSPGGPYLGEFNSTLAALEHGGLHPSSIEILATPADAAAALGTYDVLLFMEHSRCTPVAADWVDTVIAHLAGGGRVVATYCISFINALGLFGTGTSTSEPGPYTVGSHEFWDGGVTHPVSGLNSTRAWIWTGDYLVPLAWIASASTHYTVWGYEVP